MSSHALKVHRDTCNCCWVYHNRSIWNVSVGGSAGYTRWRLIEEPPVYFRTVWGAANELARRRVTQ